MEFQITGIDPDLIRKTYDIPDVYKMYRFSYARTYMVSSPPADILYNVFRVNGCTMANNLFVIRQNVELLPTVSGPFSAINCMLRGSLQVDLHRHDQELPIKVWLRQGQYNAFQVDQRNENPHRAYFTPGIYEAQHFDYTRDALATLAPSSVVVQEWLKRIDENLSSDAIIQSPGIVWPELHRLIAELKNFTIKSKISEALFENKLKQVLIMVLEREEHNSHQMHRPEQFLIDTIGAYIGNNLEKDHHLEDLAKSYCCSVSKLRKDFVKYTGKSFSEFLVELRMARAEELLKEGYTNAQVAERIGYRSTSSFARQYKKISGRTPGQERAD